MVRKPAGDEEAHFMCEVSPALGFEQLIETMYGLAADGKTNRTTRSPQHEKPPPRTWDVTGKLLPWPRTAMSEETRQRVQEARVGRLATVDSEGRPHVVPVCFTLAGDVLYSAVDLKPKRSPRLRRLENIRSNPEVAVLIDHYEEVWSRLWWIRLRGHGRVLETGEERERALTLLAEKYPQYRAQRPIHAVIAIDLHDWQEWHA